MSFDLGPALLFCPADRPDRYAKAAARADAVILDLEDAVAPGNRPAARAAIVDHPLDPDRTIIRVNGFGTPDYAADLEALRATSYHHVMLAKASAEADFDELSAWSLIGLCETAAGVTDARRIAAAAPVVALMWGAEDLVASMGGSSSRGSDGGYRAVVAQARASVALAAAAEGAAMIDAVHLDIADRAGLAEEAADAAALGFAATACIHPDQVEVIRSAYRPADAEVSWARGVLDAAAHGGVTVFDGRMVDEPILRHARSVLRRVRPA